MGMDVYGKKPRTEEGKYFRNNVWWWRPLADYCLSVSQVAHHCEHWHTNDGAGLNNARSLKLADELQAEIDAGRALAYEKHFTSQQEMTPDEPCSLCEGTGTRKPVPERGAGDALTGIKCNACDGEGHVRPFSTMYPFTVENVQEFVTFLRGCGGFKIC